jgi:hypothetical protein
MRKGSISWLPLILVIGIIVTVAYFVAKGEIESSATPTTVAKANPTSTDTPMPTLTNTAVPIDTPTSPNSVTPSPTDTPRPTPTDTSVPSPLPTSTWTPTSTITPTPAPDAAVVSAYGLNLRSGPGIDYDLVGSLRNGEALNIQGRTINNRWIKIISVNRGIQGWVSALPEYVQINVDWIDIPVVTAPPTPTPTSTLTLLPISATASPTPAFSYTAPTLTGPENNSQVSGEFPPLYWSWDGQLGEDEFYEVRIWHESITTYHPALGWVKVPQFDYNVKGERSGKYYWTVLVVEGANARRKIWTLQPWWPYPMWEGDLVRELSPESEPRFFNFECGGPCPGSNISNPDAPQPEPTPWE